MGQNTDKYTKITRNFDHLINIILGITWNRQDLDIDIAMDNNRIEANNQNIKYRDQGCIGQEPFTQIFWTLYLANWTK